MNAALVSTKSHFGEMLVELRDEGSVYRWRQKMPLCALRERVAWDCRELPESSGFEGSLQIVEDVGGSVSSLKASVFRTGTGQQPRQISCR